MSKKYFVTVLLFIGTILILIATNLNFPENITAQEQPLCFMTQPSGQVANLSDICATKKESVGNRQDLKAEKEIQGLSVKALDQMQKGQFQQALDNLTQVININPNMPEVYYERGTMYIATKNPQAAIADFQRSANLYRTIGDSQSADNMQQLIEETQRNFL